MPSVGAVLASCNMSSTSGAIQEREGGGMAPNSLVKATCISKQYLSLGWPDGGLQVGNHDGKWEGELSASSDPCRSLHLGLALPFGHLPEGWLQAFYQLGHSIWQPLT